MKYLSCDLETTGLLDEYQSGIWEIAAIVEDTENPLPFEELPKFNVFVLQPNFTWSNEALEVNHKGFLDYLAALKQIKSDYKEYYKKMEEECEAKKPHEESCMYYVSPSVYYCSEPSFYEGKNIMPKYCAEQYFNLFLNEHFGRERITVAGKNVGAFDIPFLRKEHYNSICDRFRVRTLDPSILYMNSNDKYAPSLQDCLDRIPASYRDASIVSHNALEDAFNVIEAFRYKQSIGAFLG